MYCIQNTITTSEYTKISSTMFKYTVKTSNSWPAKLPYMFSCLSEKFTFFFFFFSVMVEENRKLDISYLISWFLSSELVLSCTPNCCCWSGKSFCMTLPKPQKITFFGFSILLLPLPSHPPHPPHPLPNKHFYIDIDTQASKHHGKHFKSSIHILERS